MQQCLRVFIESKENALRISLFWLKGVALSYVEQTSFYLRL